MTQTPQQKADRIQRCLAQLIRDHDEYYQRWLEQQRAEIARTIKKVRKQ